MIYELGYDITGKIVVINQNGEYIMHIPCTMTPNEVLQNLYTNPAFLNSASEYIISNTEVAAKDKWPLFASWHAHNVMSQATPISLEEFINAWQEPHQGGSR